MSVKLFDYVVIGSGCSGAMAAQTLVEAGVNVTMIDVGKQDTTYAPLIPDKHFTDIRRTESEQYRYLIGDELEGVGWGGVGKGEQITPARRHIMQATEEYLRIISDTFSPLESLGYGGLGIGWGLQCWQYSPADLRAAGLPVGAMTKAYETVSSRIGISGSKDDAAQYTLGKLKTFQPSPVMDENHERIYAKYARRRAYFNARGFFLGRTPLALITEDFQSRKAYAYNEMDFYSDKDRSAWRPWITVDQLRQHKNFTYLDGHLVTKFAEHKNYTEIHCLTVPDNKLVIFHCRKLVLASGSLGSARIVLRSFDNSDKKLPLLCNPYTYIPCLQPAMLGKAMGDKKLGFAQLSLFLDEAKNNFGLSVASLYDYHSLMLFRIVKQAPLNFADARIVMRYLMPALEIMGVHHPDNLSSDKYVRLVADNTTPTGDHLQAAYSLSADDQATYSQRERKFIGAMRRMGTYALKRINPGYGASIHYAGSLQFGKQQQAYSLAPNGQLHGTRSVFVADSSGFNYLPARGLTFTIMANAHLTAKEALRNV